jgi:hypothetical protein
MDDNEEKFIQMLIQLNHQMYQKYKEHDNFPRKIIVIFNKNELPSIERESLI